MPEPVESAIVDPGRPHQRDDLPIGVGSRDDNRAATRTPASLATAALAPPTTPQPIRHRRRELQDAAARQRLRHVHPAINRRRTLTRHVERSRSDQSSAINSEIRKPVETRKSTTNWSASSVTFARSRSSAAGATCFGRASGGFA